MKPMRQIEAAQLMVTMNKYTINSFSINEQTISTYVNNVKTEKAKAIGFDGPVLATGTFGGPVTEQADFIRQISEACNCAGIR